jgi:hypothetical protein
VGTGSLRANMGYELIVVAIEYLPRRADRSSADALRISSQSRAVSTTGWCATSSWSDHHELAAMNAHVPLEAMAYVPPERHGW